MMVTAHGANRSALTVQPLRAKKENNTHGTRRMASASRGFNPAIAPETATTRCPIKYACPDPALVMADGQTLDNVIQLGLFAGPPTMEQRILGRETLV
jgi:hypothetical protein